MKVCLIWYCEVIQLSKYLNHRLQLKFWIESPYSFSMKKPRPYLNLKIFQTNFYCLCSNAMTIMVLWWRLSYFFFFMNHCYPCFWLIFLEFLFENFSNFDLLIDFFVLDDLFCFLFFQSFNIHFYQNSKID